MNINDKIKVIVELSNEERGIIYNCILFTQKLYNRIKFTKLDSNIEAIREFGAIVGDTREVELTSSDIQKAIDACTAIRDMLKLENNPAARLGLEWEEWYLLSSIINDNNALKHFKLWGCTQNVIEMSEADIAGNPLLNALNMQ